VTVLYNLVLLAVDCAAIFIIRRSKSIFSWVLTLIATALIAALLAAIMATDHFDFIRLAAYGIFLHGTVLALGSTLAWWRTKKGLATLSGTASVFLVSLVYYIFLVEPFWLEVSYWQISSPKIHQSLRIVVVADLQTDNFGDYERSVLRRAMEEKPDLLLLAGDYIQAPGQQYQLISQQINKFLRDIHFSAPNGIYAVQGNVDPPNWHEIFNGLNITAVNARQTFDIGELRLTCLGLGESFTKSLTMTNPDPDSFHLVLGHSPDFALGRIDADLLIAGHTHGGQVCLPLIGPPIVLARVPRSWASGLTILPDGAKLLVSRGIGMERSCAPRMRFLCRPELMVIDLKPEQSNKENSTDK